jgi:hypothetical protein
MLPKIVCRRNRRYIAIRVLASSIVNCSKSSTYAETCLNSNYLPPLSNPHVCHTVSQPSDVGTLGENIQPTQGRSCQWCLKLENHGRQHRLSIVLSVSYGTKVRHRPLVTQTRYVIIMWCYVMGSLGKFISRFRWMYTFGPPPPFPNLRNYFRNTVCVCTCINVRLRNHLNGWTFY